MTSGQRDSRGPGWATSTRTNKPERAARLGTPPDSPLSPRGRPPPEPLHAQHWPAHGSHRECHPHPRAVTSRPGPGALRRPLSAREVLACRQLHCRWVCVPRPVWHEVGRTGTTGRVTPDPELGLPSSGLASPRAREGFSPAERGVSKGGKATSIAAFGTSHPQPRPPRVCSLTGVRTALPARPRARTLSILSCSTPNRPP